MSTHAVADDRRETSTARIEVTDSAITARTVSVSGRSCTANAAPISSTLRDRLTATTEIEPASFKAEQLIDTESVSIEMTQTGWIYKHIPEMIARNI